MRKLKRYSKNAKLEVDYAPNGKWIMILDDNGHRNLVGMFRWRWQYKLFCFINRDIPVVFKERG